MGISPDGRWLVIGVARTFDQTDLYLQDLAPAAAAGAGGEGPARLVRGRGGARPALHAHQPRRADLPAVRGGSRAARSRRRGGRSSPPRPDAVLEGVRVTARPSRAQLPRARVVPAAADRPRRRRARARSRCRRSAASSAPARSGTAGSCSTASRRTPCRPASTGSTSRPGATSCGAGWRPTWTRPVRGEPGDGPLARTAPTVSMFLVHRTGLARDGQQPGLPHRLRRVQHQHDAGVLALAAALAGATAASSPSPTSGAAASTASSWHQAGMLGRKQNSFDDFIAAAEWLIDERIHHGRRAWRSPGGSNGGLLMGAVLTQRPDLFRAVVVPGAAARHAALPPVPDRPAVDPGVRLGRRPGAVPLAARLLARITTCGTASPIRRCSSRPRRATPGWIRCTPARWRPGCRRRPSSARPILLRLESRAGHGAGKPLAKVLEELTDTWAFVFSEWGWRFE